MILNTTSQYIVVHLLSYTPFVTYYTYLSFDVSGIGFPEDVCQKLGQVRLKLPDDITVGFFANQIILSLRSKWKVNNQSEFIAGSLLAASVIDVMADPLSGEDKSCYRSKMSICHGSGSSLYGH